MNRQRGQEAERRRASTHPRSGSPATLGVVIPTLNEERAVPRLLTDLRRVRLPLDVVVSDGGSRDRTLEVARAGGARIVRSPRGRAHQMNAGARALNTAWLLFLHADSHLPPGTIRALERWIRDPHPSGAAHFAFQLDRRGPGWKLIEGGQRIRERVTGLAYGDQGLVISRGRFDAVGGIPVLPIMEDVEVIRTLRRTGGVDRIPAPVLTSSRRYREEGPVHALIRNAAIVSLFSLGVPPRVLVRWYRPRRFPEERSTRMAPSP